MDVAWVSDPHLDHCDDSARRRFLHDLATTRVDAVVIPGDRGSCNRVSLTDFTLVGDLAPPAWSRPLLLDRLGKPGDRGG